MEISHRHHYCISKTNQRGEVLLKSRRYLLMLIWDSMIFPSRGAAVSNHTTVLSLSFCSVIQKKPHICLVPKSLYSIHISILKFDRFVALKCRR